MSWKTVNDPAVLRHLLSMDPIGQRIIMLDPASDDLARIETLALESVTTVKAAAKYSIHVYATNPATVVVMDLNTGKPVAVYAWAGSGGALAGSKDSRVVQLADALEREYLGLGQIPEWQEPDLVSKLHGENINPGVHAPMGDVDFGFAGEPRISLEEGSATKWGELAAHHCNDAQVKAINRLFKKKHLPAGMLNLRKHGDAAIGELIPILADKFGNQWIVKTNGTIERWEE